MTPADLDALAEQYASPEYIELQYALDGRPAGRAIIITRGKQSAYILYSKPSRIQCFLLYKLTYLLQMPSME